jgi:NitT/TauT family transport system substrate-binding protein
MGTIATFQMFGNYAAIESGIYKQQGIELELVPFDSAALMVAPLSTNQIDVAHGAPSAGLWNAINRGIGMKVISDLGYQPKGRPGFFIIVRKALIDGGKVKTVADFKGLKYSQPAPGISAELEMSLLLKEGGLTLKDLTVVNLGLADATAAMASGAIDIGLFSEPFASQIAVQGTGTLFRGSDDILPNGQTGIVFVSPDFSTKTDLINRFAMAHVLAARLYNDAFVKNIAATREQVLTAAIKYFPIKDRAVYDRVKFPGVHPDGKLDLKSLDLQQDYFVQIGTQTGGKVDLTKAVDTRGIDAAVAKLGAYK